MKKFFLSVIVLAAAAVSANAQLNVEFGMSSGNYLFNNNFRAKAAANAAILFDIPVGETLSESLFIEPGVRFAMKNASLVRMSNVSLNLSWLEVPIYFGSTLPLGPNWSLVAKVGVYYAFNLSQKMAIGAESYDLIAGMESRIIAEVLGQNDPLIISRHDAGVTGSVMFFYKFLGIGTGYSYGVLNTAAQIGSSAHTSCCNVNLAFRF